jgi:hypothetical protein
VNSVHRREREREREREKEYKMAEKRIGVAIA